MTKSVGKLKRLGHVEQKVDTN